MHMDYGLNLNVLSCFFFKQKTAYEMRISDWSSDVCSSDLLTENPDEAVDAGFFRARIAEAVCLRRESLRLDDVSDAWRVVHSEGDGLSGLVVDRYGDLLVVEFFSAGMYRRSEEHTSELQSLVRISYAVFCLKKTKKTK